MERSLLQNGLSGVSTAYEIVERLKDYQNIEVSFLKDKNKKGNAYNAISGNLTYNGALT